MTRRSPGNPGSNASHNQTADQSDRQRVYPRKRTVVDMWRTAIRTTPNTLTPTERHVAYVASCYMDWRTGQNMYAGPARIAAETGYNVTTVKRALASLVAKGWLVIFERGGFATKGGQRRANNYAATLPRPVAQDYRSDDEETAELSPTGSAVSTTGSTELPRPVAQDPTTTNDHLLPAQNFVSDVATEAVALEVDVDIHPLMTGLVRAIAREAMVS